MPRPQTIPSTLAPKSAEPGSHSAPKTHQKTNNTDNTYNSNNTYNAQCQP